jgi:hypothetical protein
MDTDARGFPPEDMRVSDAERDRALSELSESYQSGRITVDEFDRRSTQALSARTGKELIAPLADLPLDRGPVDAAPRTPSPRDEPMAISSPGSQSARPSPPSASAASP